MHRDVKPENVLFHIDDRCGMMLKLCDFGLSRISRSNTDCRTFCGTPQYMPPEVIAFAVPCCNYDLCGYGKNADLWSFGIVLHVMVCAAEPFAEEGLYDSIMSVDVDVDNEEWHAVSSSAAVVMRGLLRYAPSARMSATSILEFVNTEWPSIDHAIQ